MTEITTLMPRKITYSVLVNVHHWSGERISSIRIESEIPLGPFIVGDRLWIGGDLDGFPESRLTMGKVRGIKHSLSGNTLELTHEITVDVDEDRETAVGRKATKKAKKNIKRAAKSGHKGGAKRSGSRR